MVADVSNRSFEFIERERKNYGVSFFSDINLYELN